MDRRTAVSIYFSEEIVDADTHDKWVVAKESLDNDPLFLGAGAMGYVFKDEGGDTCTKYCVIPKENDNELTNARLAHEIGLGPAVYSSEVIADLGEELLVSYTMDLLKGQTLQEYVKQGDEWMSWVPEYLTQLIGYMHSHSLVHHDLHKENIWVTPDLDLFFIDWGISSSQGEHSPQELDWDYIYSGVIEESPVII